MAKSRVHYMEREVRTKKYLLPEICDTFEWDKNPLQPHTVPLIHVIDFYIVYNQDSGYLTRARFIYTHEGENIYILETKNPTHPNDIAITDPFEKPKIITEKEYNDIIRKSRENIQNSILVAGNRRQLWVSDIAYSSFEEPNDTLEVIFRKKAPRIETPHVLHLCFDNVYGTLVKNPKRLPDGCMQRLMMNMIQGRSDKLLDEFLGAFTEFETMIPVDETTTLDECQKRSEDANRLVFGFAEAIGVKRRDLRYDIYPKQVYDLFSKN